MNEASKQAKENFDRAAALVKEGKYLEAICVDLLESDIVVIVKKIKRQVGANDNRTEGK